MTAAQATAGAYLLHPAVWLAIAVLVINVHELKSHAPSWMTGKLSDVAGLVFFPVLLSGAVDLSTHWLGKELSTTARRRSVVVAVAVTGFVFAAIQVLPSAANIYVHALALLQWPYHAAVAVFSSAPVPTPRPPAHTADVSDLMALPALLIPLWIGRRR